MQVIEDQQILETAWRIAGQLGDKVVSGVLSVFGIHQNVRERIHKTVSEQLFQNTAHEVLARRD